MEDGQVAAVLDPRQIVRIEAVHRGFAYQHLYATQCLLLAEIAGVTSILVERDEDVEIVQPGRRIYVQIKSRQQALSAADLDGVFERFAQLRIEHQEARREGAATFVIASNAPPNGPLAERLRAADWPGDVQLLWPGGPDFADPAIPRPSATVADAHAQCAALASKLPFGMLTPETLVWKLAGCVAQASAGEPPREDHSFQTAELPELFEQLVVQLQEFPAPPAVYRAQEGEPPLVSEARVRLVVGYSGAGKTSWASEAASHATGTVAYFDAIDTPGPALASALARDLAAKLFGHAGGGLGHILLPGSSGTDILQGIGARLAKEGRNLTLVLDNAHRLPAPDLHALINRAAGLQFVLLAQPGRPVAELEALLSISSEALQGWAADTVAEEVLAAGCRADFGVVERLRTLTGSLPLYVQNALQIAAREYDGDVAALCSELETRTHSVETAQELILARVFDALPAKPRDCLAVLSLSDVPLDRADAAAFLEAAAGLQPGEIPAVLRQLRSAGVLELFGPDRLKVHDAMRLVGRAQLQAKGAEERRAQMALKDIISVSLKKDWEMSKLSLYLHLLADLGDVKTLVQFATDELFHELGVWPNILTFLEAAAGSDQTLAEDRFWALDGLAFSAAKHGDWGKVAEHIQAMEPLIAEGKLGADERLAFGMKRMHVLARAGKIKELQDTVAEVSRELPEKPGHIRVFKYNFAHVLFSLRLYDAVIKETDELIKEYYEVLGIRPEDVIGKNGDKIRPLLKKGDDLTDDLKHLADSLDLYAMAMNAADRDSRLARIHAMKFYELAQALDSMVRVGQDLIDEVVGRKDFAAARQFMEDNLLPIVQKAKLVNKIIPVRSQYAVVLAMCGAFDAAEAEMRRLEPYEAGLDLKGQWELRNQRRAIAEMRRTGPPKQWEPPGLPVNRNKIDGRKVGRNDPCPCGSGRKFKKCHGGSA